MSFPFKHILIYGLGLMGGSIALALKQKNFRGKVSGIVRDKNDHKELSNGAIVDEVILDSEFAKLQNWDDFDLIIYCLPVHVICQKILKIPDSYKGYITDIGSTKTRIIKTVELKFLKSHNYCSSHPMAGSEHAGLKYAKPDLYKNKLCILTSPNKASEKAKKFIADFWKFLDMITFNMNSETHDEVLSYLSHSPHILSSLMVIWVYKNLSVSKSIGKCNVSLSGGGFRDMSRIAGSNPDMWNAIISLNKEPIYKSLIEFQKDLNELIKILGSDESETNGFWKSYFKKAKEARNKILKLKEK